MQWRRVLDMEVGEYPDVRRDLRAGRLHALRRSALHARVPVDRDAKASDGMVTIDYDLCIGCGYCAVACPYQARYKADRASFAYGEAMPTETTASMPSGWRWRPSAPSASTASMPAWQKGYAGGSIPEATPGLRQRLHLARR